MFIEQSKPRKDGKVRHRAVVYHQGGYEKSSWHKHEEHAKQEWIEIKKSLDNGTYHKPTTETFEEVYLSYRELVAPNKMGKEALVNEEGTYQNHLKPIFGHRKLVSITPIEIQELWKEKEDCLANSSIIKLHTIMNKVYKFAIRLNKIRYNPLDSVEKPPPNHKKAHIWNKAQLRLFLEQAKDYQSYMVFWLAANAGLRRGEILGLTWDNLDFDRNLLRIVQTYHSSQKKLIQATKTATSQREVSMSVNQMLVLKEHKEKQDPKTDLVCANQNGGFLMDRNIRRAKEAICKRCGLEPIKLHEFRHTHGSMLSDMNEPTKYIQERLGHKDVSTTINYYVHTQKSHHQETANRFDDFLND